MPRSFDPYSTDPARSVDRIAASLSEEQIHLEHRAALDATVLRSPAAARKELVLELVGGQLRVCPEYRKRS